VEQGAAIAPKLDQVHRTPSLTGVKVLLEGPTGTGKTTAIGTLIDWCAAQQPQLEVCCLFLERGLETVLGYYADKKRELPANLRWRDVIAKPVSLAQMAQAADSVGKLSYDGITKMSDGSRSVNNPFYQMLIACTDYIDDRTGKHLGPVDAWDEKRILVVDSLSAASNFAMKMVIGSKPTASPGEYGIAQNNLMNWLRLCTEGMKSHFVLTAHISREKDDISGGIKLMTQAIGSAISGLIPPLFSEVILTTREGAAFYWDTANPNVDLKTRYLPIQSKLPPDFKQIMDKWLARAKSAQTGTT
jgi:hypothetical protein